MLMPTASHLVKGEIFLGSGEVIAYRNYLRLIYVDIEPKKVLQSINSAPVAAFSILFTSH